MADYKILFGACIMMLILMPLGIAPTYTTPDNDNISISSGTINITMNGIKAFNIKTGRTPIAVGNLSQTKEWGYNQAGTDTILNSENFDIIEEEYICLKGYTQTINQDNGAFHYSTQKNPYCIKYPQIYNLTKDGDTIKLINWTFNKENITISYFAGYDPALWNYTGNCNSSCNISTDYYNVTLTKGVITKFYYNYVQPGKNWGMTSPSNGTNIGDLLVNGNYVFTATMTIPINCSLTNNTDNFFIACNTRNATNNWTFYNSYIKLETWLIGAGQIMYSIYSPQINRTTAWNGTNSRTSGTSYTDWDSLTGIMALQPNNASFSNATFIVTYDEAVLTDFDFRTNQSTNQHTNLIIGRTSLVPAATILTQYIKVINGTNPGIQQSFKADPLFNDIASGSTSTCSCPSAADWWINMADHCNITSNCDISGKIIHFVNGTAGDYFNVSATITCSKMNITGAISGTKIIGTSTGKIKYG